MIHSVRRCARPFRPVRGAVVALAVVSAAGLTACSATDDSDAPPTSAAPVTSTLAAPSGSSAATLPTTSPVDSTPTRARSAEARSVHVSLLNSDGATYGVGMPVIAYFSTMITDAAPLQRATTVTVDGTPAQGAWYFERSGAGNGPIEGHYRLADYWPAHAHVRVDIKAEGVSAGKGLVYDNTLFSDFRTGAANVSVVDDAKHEITVTSDGKQVGTYPVSLGAKGSPTERGIKVIMEQDRDTRMQGNSLSGHYDDPHVYWTQRLTYGGEYLHAAPWNDPALIRGGNIGSGNSSNGCTNLTTRDARTLFQAMRVGDVVRYPNAGGPRMKLSDGYGDWNLTWQEWQTGGLIATT